MYETLMKNSIIVNKDPLIGYVDNLIDDDTCEYIINKASPKLTESKVCNNDGNKKSSIRTSYNTWLTYNKDDLVSVYGKKISELVGIPLSHAESMCVIHYDIGQKYSQHCDSFNLDEPRGQRVCRNGHQRIFTVLSYLNTPEAGGETRFPNLKVTVKAKKGRVVFFSNVGNDINYPHPNSLHESKPVITGEKYAATMWFHAAPYSTKFTFPCSPPKILQEL